MPLPIGAPLPELPGSQPTMVLAVFKEGCDTCATALPWVQRLEGVVPVLGVAQEASEEASRVAREMGLSAPVVADPEPHGLSASLDVAIVPTVMVVREGRVARVMEGWSRAAFEALARDAGWTRGPVVSGDDVPVFRPG